MKKIFLELNYRNLTTYIEDLAKSTKNDRGNVFNLLKIGETYLKYREELEKIGFTSSDGTSKLPYLERALAKGEKKEVFDNLKNMTLRKFKAYTKSSDAKIVEDAVPWEIRGNILYIKGQSQTCQGKYTDVGRQATHGERLETNLYAVFTTNSVL